MANPYYLLRGTKQHALLQDVVKGTILVGHNNDGLIPGQCAQ